jgi:hypothetical protein
MRSRNPSLESGPSTDDRQRLLAELLALNARMEAAHARLAERLSSLGEAGPAERTRSPKGREQAK